MEKQKKAYLYACLAVVFWSTSASAFKISLAHLDVLTLLLLASTTSAIVLLLYLLSQNKLRLLKALSKEDYLRSAFLGFLNPFLYYTVLFKAYSILLAQEAQPLNFIWPLTLVLLSIPILKQKIKRKDILAILISFFGVFIISTGGHILRFKFTDTLGVLLATGSSIPWALFWIYNMKDKRDDLVKLFLNFAFASAYVFLALLLFGKVRIPGIYGILGATYVGLFEMGITFLIRLKALKLSKTTTFQMAGVRFVRLNADGVYVMRFLDRCRTVEHDDRFFYDTGDVISYLCDTNEVCALVKSRIFGKVWSDSQACADVDNNQKFCLQREVRCDSNL
jgi:drug/metabolite transporter (DMT)-like permease